jgi:hypothetical protein
MVYDQGGSVMSLFVFEGNGGTTFSSPKKYWESGPWWGVANTKFTTSGDFNADGKQDLAMVYDQGGSVMSLFVFEGNGGTTFSSPKKYWESGPWWGVANTKFTTSGDFNADGKQDLAMVYDQGGSVMSLFVFE